MINLSGMYNEHMKNWQTFKPLIYWRVKKIDLSEVKKWK